MWFRQPNGVIVQSWVGITTTGNGDTITFPNAFPTACCNVLAHEGHGSGGWPGNPTIYSTQDMTQFNFALYCAQWDGISAFVSGVNVGYRYIAIGY
jgi:hypothetical protein